MKVVEKNSNPMQSRAEQSNAEWRHHCTQEMGQYENSDHRGFCVFSHGDNLLSKWLTMNQTMLTDLLLHCSLP